MLQFYLLSVVMNLIAGVMLSAGYLETKIPVLSGIKEFVEARPGLNLTIGIITLIVGLFKLLSVTNGDVPVVGDLLPALAGLTMGYMLILDYYKSKSDVTSPFVATSERIFLANRIPIGIAGMVIAVVHFLLPRVLFL
ncbi:MAG TPA: hypothetical protein VMV68_09060 [Spirochaetia bacterium]|nr:hypothetical protein [Spirochaetia bacterium]